MVGSRRTLLSLLLAFGLTHCASPTEEPPAKAPPEAEEDRGLAEPEQVEAQWGSCPRAYLVEDSNEGPEGAAPRGLTELGDRLFYWADDGLHGSEPWRSDGTRAGTRLIEDIVAGPEGSGAFPFERAVVGRRIFFPVDDALWKSDGTPGGTSRVLAFPAGARPSNFLEYRGKLLFAVTTPAYGREVWISDGTASGTRLWVDINPGPASGFQGDMIELEGDVVFDSLIGAGASSRRVVVRVDSRRRVTELFSIPGDDEVGIFRLTAVDGSVFFLVDVTDGEPELVVSDGTEGGSRFLRDFSDSPVTPRDFTSFRGLLYFAAGTFETGTELWRSDGTPEGTEMAVEIRPGEAGSGPGGLTVVKDRLYFAATDGVHGRELWVSDGSAEGTALAADIRPGPESSLPLSFYRVNKRLYFSADDGVHGQEPWKFDGGRARLVADIAPGAASSLSLAFPPEKFQRAGERLYVIADDGTHGEELWAIPLSDAGCPRGSR